MRFKYKYEAIPAIIYYFISLAAFVFAYSVHDGTFAGIYISMLTKPWSSIGFDALDSLQYGVMITDTMYLQRIKYHQIIYLVSIVTGL